MDREKVINHIVAEIIIARTCKKDFASVDIDMLSDALAILKEQEETIKNLEQEIRDKNIRLKERAEQVRKEYIDIFEQMVKEKKKYFINDEIPIRISYQCVVDILALMKDQEAVKPRVSSAEQRCGNCNKVIEMDGWKACPWCGKPILWEAVGRSVK